MPRDGEVLSFQDLNSNPVICFLPLLFLVAMLSHGDTILGGTYGEVVVDTPGMPNRKRLKLLPLGPV